MATSGGPDIITSGLVLHLDAGSVKSYPGSGTTWYDLSGNENNCSLANGPTFSNGTLNFDGINDYGTTASIYNPAEFSVSIWYKANSFTDGLLYGGERLSWLVTKRDNSSDNHWQITTNDNYFRFSIFNGSTTNVGYLLTSGLLVNKWYNCVFTINGTTGGDIKSYLNGIFDTSTTATGNMKLGYREIYISSAWSPPNHVDFGTLSSVIIYNRILSSSEILTNYKATKSRFNL